MWHLNWSVKLGTINCFDLNTPAISYCVIPDSRPFCGKKWFIQQRIATIVCHCIEKVPILWDFSIPWQISYHCSANHSECLLIFSQRPHIPVLIKFPLWSQRYIVATIFSKEDEYSVYGVWNCFSELMILHFTIPHKYIDDRVDFSLVHSSPHARC